MTKDRKFEGGRKAPTESAVELDEDRLDQASGGFVEKPVKLGPYPKEPAR